MADSDDLTRQDRLYAVAEEQAGHFATAQARAVGYRSSQLAYHVGTGRFRRIRRGVYRLAQFPAAPHEDLYVAWLEVGPRAVVSHDSALAVYELSDALPAAVHLTVPRSASRRRRAGLILHRNALDARDVTRYLGLPITTVPRTIADVAADGLAEELVAQAAHEAVQRGLVTAADLRKQALARGGRAARIVDRAL